MSCAGCEDCTLIQIGSAVSPFEIHITVDPQTDKDLFSKTCLENDIKPLFILNFGSNSSMPVMDMMTRSIVKGSPEDAGNEMFRVACVLHKVGIKTVRSKIETVPWIFDKVKDISKETNVPYFETHIEVEVPGYGFVDMDYVISNARRWGGYVSQNTNKSTIAMVTFRLDQVNAEEFKIYSTRMRDNLLSTGMKIGRDIVELTFHDDNKAHDDTWINAV